MTSARILWRDTISHGFIWRPSGMIESLPKIAERSSDAVIDVTQKIPSDTPAIAPLVVADIKRAKVVGNCTLLADSRDKVVWGVQGLNALRLNPRDRALKRTRLCLRRYLSGSALLLDANSGNYFHWSFEAFPRLKLLQLPGYRLDDLDWILLNSDHAPFQLEMLTALDISAQKIFRCSRRNVYQFDRLIVPSHPSSVSGDVRPWVVELLREKFLSAVSPDPARLLYISRTNTKRRSMLNELDLQAALTQKGFEICHPEKLSVAEQARLFASARCIVAPHGAALTNLVYASPGTRLIELFGPHNRNHCYESLSQVLALKYQSIRGHDFAAQANPDGQADPFSIDIRSVMAHL